LDAVALEDVTDAVVVRHIRLANASICGLNRTASPIRSSTALLRLS
jgi:hypothetical protein